MPNTRNLRNLNYLCFSSNSTSKHESPPLSPTNVTPSSHNHHHQIHGHNPPSPSPSSINMIKNFNSLYDPTLTLHDHSLRISSLSTLTTTTTTSFESELETQPEPDFAAAFSSQRFFFSTPGPSNSLIEYTNNTNTPSLSSMDTHQKPNCNSGDNSKNNKSKKTKKKVVFSGSVAVPTYSPDPYLDFRRSMQEMVEARPELMDVKSNWNVLHELLLCYLALNPKSTHKFIIGAFADLLVSLMPF